MMKSTIVLVSVAFVSLDAQAQLRYDVRDGFPFEEFCEQTVARLVRHPDSYYKVMTRTESSIGGLKIDVVYEAKGDSGAVVRSKATCRVPDRNITLVSARVNYIKSDQLPVEIGVAPDGTLVDTACEIIVAVIKTLLSYVW